jgi:hypothetical protein
MLGPSHWLQQISLPKRVHNHFWHGLIPLTKNTLPIQNTNNNNCIADTIGVLCSLLPTIRFFLIEEETLPTKQAFRVYDFFFSPFYWTNHFVDVKLLNKGMDEGRLGKKNHGAMFDDKNSL